MDLTETTMNTRTKIMTETEKQLLTVLSSQVEAVVNTLMQLRKPETAYEIMRAVDSARGVLHWAADGYGAIKLVNTQ
jgi:hypothetical protein